jgi:acetyl esterase/lipase
MKGVNMTRFVVHQAQRDNEGSRFIERKVIKSVLFGKDNDKRLRMDSFEANQPQRDSVRFRASITAGYRPAADGILDDRILNATRFWTKAARLGVGAPASAGKGHSNQPPKGGTPAGFDNLQPDPRAFRLWTFLMALAIFGWPVWSFQNRAAAESLASDSGEARLRIESDVAFQTIDGVSVYADLFRPRNDDRLPGIIMIHGGAWVTGDKWSVITHAQEMAREGFVVMTINYRLAPKFQWPAQWDDCRQALRWLSEHAEQWKVDVERIGTWGYSAGGHLALMMALDQAADLPPVKACVAGGAPCDLSALAANGKLLKGFLGGTRAERPDRYREASPTSRLSSDDPPLFFFHGNRDVVVPIDNSRTCYEQAKKIGLQADYFQADDLGHLMTLMNPEARRQAIDFFKKHLQAIPRPEP